MTIDIELGQLLAGLEAELAPGVYVFAVTATDALPSDVRPFATIAEDEGMTVVVLRQDAERAGLAYDYRAARITLQVRSDLAAVGLTAAVSAPLAAAGISCNIIAGQAHDHLFVPHYRAAEALAILHDLAHQHRRPDQPRADP